MFASAKTLLNVILIFISFNLLPSARTYETQFLHVHMHPASPQVQQRPYKADGFARGGSFPP